MSLTAFLQSYRAASRQQFKSNEEKGMMIMQRTILDFTKIGFSHGLRYNEVDDINEVISEIKKCILDNLLPVIDLNAKTRYIWHADYNPVDLLMLINDMRNCILSLEITMTIKFSSVLMQQQKE